MANVYKGLTIEFEGDATGLISALNKIKASSRGVSSELRTIDKALKFNPSSSALMTRQIELMKKSIESTKRELDAYKTAEQQIGKGGMSSEAWTKLQSDIAIAENKLDTFNKSYHQAVSNFVASQSTLGKTGAAIEQWGNRYTTAGERIAAIGSALTKGVTLPMAAAGAASVAAAVTIDTSLTNVKKTVDGTEQQYQALKKAAIDFSKTNAVSATEILDIQSLGAQLGFAVDELDEFSRVVSGLDIATDLNAQDAATQLAQFANITKMSHGEVSNYGSAVVALGNNFATTESKVSAMAMRIAAAGTQVGMSQADILGLAAALSSMGIEAEAGGTAISTVMSSIDKAVATNSDTVQTWASTAKMSAAEFSAAWQTDPVHALSAVLSGMEAATQEGGNMSLMLDELGISSLRQTDVMKRLAGNSELVADAVRTSNQAWQENTALQAEVDNRNESLAARFEMVKNRLIAIAEAIGTPLANALLDILDAAEPLLEGIGNIAQGFADLDSNSQRLILTAAGIVAALGPLMSLIGGMPAKVAAFGSAMQQIAVWLAKLGTSNMDATGTIKTVTSAITGMSQASAAASPVVGGLFKVLGTVGKFAGAAAAIGLVIAGLTQLASQAQEAAQYQENFAKATDGLKTAAASIPSAASSASSGIDEIGDSSTSAAEKVQRLIESQAQLADAMAERDAETSKNLAVIQGYQNTIDQLTQKTSLSKEEFLRLQNAIDGINDATGSQLSVVEGAAGSYQIMADGVEVARDAVMQLIDAMKMQAQIDNLSQDYTETMKSRAEASVALADAQKNLAAQQEKLEQTSTADTYAFYEQKKAVDEAQKTVNDATESYNSADRACNLLEDSLITMQSTAAGSANGFQQLVANSADVQLALKNNQQSCLDFADKLEQTGASVTELANLTPAQMAALGSAFDGTMGSIIGLLGEFGVATGQAAADQAAAVDQMAQQLGTLPEYFQQAFADMQVGPQQFAQALMDAGLSVQDFGTLTSDQLGLVMQSFGTNAEQAMMIAQQFVANNQMAAQQAGAAWSDWYTNLSANAQLAVTTASQTAQMSLQQFYETVPQYALASEQALMQYIQGLSTSDGSGGQQMAQTEANAAANSGAWTGSGDSAKQAYESSLTSGGGQGGNQLAQTNAQAAQGHTGEYQAAAEGGKQAYNSTLGSSDGSGGNQLAESNANAAQGHTGEYQSAADAGRTAYESGLSSSGGQGGQQLAQANASALQGAGGQFSSAGTDHGNQYIQGLTSVDSYGAGSELANNANNGASSVDGYSSGANFGAGFVAGIRDCIGDAIAAATEMVNAAKAAADAAANSHSPSREMMKRGKWFDEGFAIGIEQHAHLGAEQAEQMVNGALAVMRDNDTWVFGVHTATDYADGLYHGYNDVLDAGGALAGAATSKLDEEDAKFQAYVDRMIAGYKDRADAIKEVNSAFADVMWSAVAPEIMSTDWVKPATGSVYESMEAIKAAGYTFDEYTQKLEDMAKEKDDWDKKMSESDISDSTRDDYNEWFVQYQEWIRLNDSLTASFEDLQRWQSLYTVKNDLITGLDRATDSADDFGRMFNMTGVSFSKNFVERVVAGGEEYAQAIHDMSNMTSEQVQEMVDSFDDLARAERLEEINQRSLWVNSLKTLQTTGQNAKDWLLDYRETCLDVKEAIYSDSGLSAAFEKGGVSIEGFALELQAMDTTMADFESRMDAFVGKVTDGFSQMTKYKQTGLDEWTRNLKLNMAESQAYANDLATVMAKLPDTLDATAFRNAIAEGGFEKWGQVISDLAGKSGEEIVATVELYNKSIVEAQQSAIEQFRALSPGEELVLATIDGIADTQDELDLCMVDASTLANEAMGETYPIWEETGSYLASGIEAGINSQIGSIAARAAAAVRAAIAAAKSEAAIASPSKKMREEVGQMMGKGIGLGMADENDYIAKQARKIINIPLVELKASQGAGASSVINNNQQTQQNVTMNVTVRNDRDMDRLIKEMNKTFNRNVRAGGQ